MASDVFFNQMPFLLVSYTKRKAQVIYLSFLFYRAEDGT